MDGCDSIGRSRNCGAMHCGSMQCCNRMSMQASVRVRRAVMINR